MSEVNENSGFVITGGSISGSNLSTGDNVTQQIGDTGSSQDALKQAFELIEQIRGSLSAESDSTLREEIADSLDDTTDALNSQSSSDESTWRRRLDRISRAVGRLGERATSLTEPLGQLAGAVAVVAGIAGH
ncbi:hypothetical protein ACWC09_39100 [Streptomyces sp. NPDC001617]